ncbi:MAG: hypothetical protein QOE99_467, partial [Actinomycetota bacterium]|jgi:hypothetical protein|nr:hypothetical protein [Actinomycetota bacterium]
MSRKRLAACLVFIGVIAGTASPALADPGDGSYACLMATHDKKHPGDPVLCVWVPVDKQP